MQSPFALANQAYAKGDFARAHVLYGSILADAPKSVPTLLNRSVCCIRRGDFAGAHADASFAVQLDPRLAKARFRLAQADARMGWTRLAAIQSRLATMLDPGVQEYRDFANAMHEVHPDALDAATHELDLLPGPAKHGRNGAARLASTPSGLQALGPPIPVTLISGFLGSGKTTLLERILAETKLRIAVVVNDMAEVNVDAQRVAVRTENLVALTNGCICCTLRDDLHRELMDLALTRAYDLIVIESSGISEPLAVAVAFSQQSLSGVTLNSVAKLDCAVTVIDCSAVQEHLASSKSLGAHDPRALANLIMEQIEFANVVILNKADLIVDSELLVKIIRGLNPVADVIVSQHCTGFALDRILLCGKFDMSVASSSARWRKELRTAHHVPESVQYGLASTVVRSSMPLDASRMSQALLRDPAAWLRRFNVLRSKGVWWACQRPQIAMDWSSAGPTLSVNVAGRWKPAVPPRVEIVFIGVDLDVPGLRNEFQAWEHQEGKGIEVGEVAKDEEGAGLLGVGAEGGGREWKLSG